MFKFGLVCMDIGLSFCSLVEDKETVYPISVEKNESSFYFIPLETVSNIDSEAKEHGFTQ